MHPWHPLHLPSISPTPKKNNPLTPNTHRKLLQQQQQQQQQPPPPPPPPPPTDRPTDRPTNRPTNQPTNQPTHPPTHPPTNQPTHPPTHPTNQPTNPTNKYKYKYKSTKKKKTRNLCCTSSTSPRAWIKSCSNWSNSSRSSKGLEISSSKTSVGVRRSYVGAFLQGDGPIGGEKIACFVQIQMKISSWKFSS